MNNIDRILYCHVPDDTEKLSQGHWFFLEQQGVQCAQAFHTDKGWRLQMDCENKIILLRDQMPFDSIDKCKDFVSEYFGLPLVDISPDNFPKPDI